eukprot:UN21365
MDEVGNRNSHRPHTGIQIEIHWRCIRILTS